MPTVERVTVTLPGSLIRDIDRIEKNRSKFVADAVRRELHRRRREALRISLQNPHPESAEVADLGFGDWASGLPEENVDNLLDDPIGRPVQWIPGEGWVERPR